jgi:hypothetical protein
LVELVQARALTVTQWWQITGGDEFESDDALYDHLHEVVAQNLGHY